VSNTSSLNLTNIVPNLVAFIDNTLHGRRRARELHAAAETAQADAFFRDLHRKQAEGAYNIPVDKT